MKLRKSAAISVIIALVTALFCLTASAASSATVTGGSVNGYIGSVVDVPITLNAGDNVASLQGQITFDSEKISYVSKTNGGFENCFIEAHMNEDEKGIINYAMISSDGVSGENVLMTLRFEVLDAASGAVTVCVTASECKNEAMKNVSVNVKNGKINIAGSLGVDNTVVDNNHNIVGSVDENGNLIDNNGNTLGVLATDDTKSDAEAVESQQNANQESSAAADEGTEISDDAANMESEQTSGGFEFEPWMLYVLLGVLFVIVIVILITSAAKQKKEKNKKERDEYKEVYADAAEKPSKSKKAEADESDDNQ